MNKVREEFHPFAEMTTGSLIGSLIIYDFNQTCTKDLWHIIFRLKEFIIKLMWSKKEMKFTTFYFLDQLGIP